MITMVIRYSSGNRRGR